MDASAKTAAGRLFQLNLEIDVCVELLGSTP
jgi:hypothetical protein